MTDPSLSAGDADPSLSGRCGRKTPRGPCKAWPVKGASVCSAHGGRAPQVKAAAVRRLARAEWARSFGEPAAAADPSATVLDLLSWTAGHVAWLRDRVQETEPDALIWGVASQVERGSGEFPGVDITKAAKANAWLELYGVERDRLLRMCEVAHRMGIADRQIEIAEEQGRLLADVIRRVLDGLHLTQVQRAQAMTIVPRELRAVAAGLDGVTV